MLSLVSSAPPRVYLLRVKSRQSPFPPLALCSSVPGPEAAADQAAHNADEVNRAGIFLDDRVDTGSGKFRLDAWISSRIPGISRARVQSSIRAGLVSVNGRSTDKVSQAIKGGDTVTCSISELQPLRAEPEDVPLDIVYEDAHILVVNKPAHMVVHPAPGNANGTLVNAIIHHCSLLTTSYRSNAEDAVCSGSDEKFNDFYADHISIDINSENSAGLIRPGIVHRLDKGTSGLLVVAKNEHSHGHLAEQFKLHSTHRIYMSLTTGVPSQNSGKIEVPIARDLNNRIRMAAVSDPHKSRHARYAVSRYKVIEVLAGGSSALVEWRLETGRTHQIRAHAKFLGIPLLGDEVYGGTISMALSLLRPRTNPNCYSHLSSILSKLHRPCLHAQELGFKHPFTGEFICFSCSLPLDFSEVLDGLRKA